MMRTIYTITVTLGPRRRLRPELNSSRCWGWWPALEGAKRALERNDGDMHECSYDFAVIERVKPYIDIAQREEWWFAWDVEKEGYVECKKPEWSKNIMNWGVG
jgi:hypothetical protein